MYCFLGLQNQFRKSFFQFLYLTEGSRLDQEKKNEI